MRDYRCTIIADPEGSAWEFAQGVYNYLVEKEKEDSTKARDSFSQSIHGSLERKFLSTHPDLLEEESLSVLQNQRLKFAQAIHDASNHEKSLFTLNPVDIRNFPDNEFKTRIRENIRRSNCFFIHDSNKEPSRWFTELCFVNHALKNSSAHEIIDVLPYLKFSRQDRKDQSRVPISAKVVADTIGLYADAVLTIDVHNEAIQGFYKISFDSLPPYPTLFRELNKILQKQDLENLAVLSPDEGAAKKIRKYFEHTGIGIAIVDKHRKIDGELGKSYGVLGPEKIKGKVVILPDDIIASAGTQIQGALAAKNHGAKKVIGYGTHALFTKGYDEAIKNLDMIIIGDTLKHPPHPSINVVSFIPLIGEAIYRINKGESISALWRKFNPLT